MLPLILTVLQRDYSTPITIPIKDSKAEMQIKFSQSLACRIGAQKLGLRLLGLMSFKGFRV